MQSSPPRCPSRRVGGEAPVPTFQPVVSSPPPSEATLTTIETYMREVLPSGKPPAPATMARRLACLSHFYRRAVYEGLLERNPVEFADRPKVPEQAATAGLGKQRARRLIAAARAEGPGETLLVLLLLELGLRISEAVGADIEDLGEQGRHRVLRIKGKGQATKAAVAPLNAAVAHAADQAVAGRTRGPDPWPTPDEWSRALLLRAETEASTGSTPAAAKDDRQADRSGLRGRSLATDSNSGTTADVGARARPSGFRVCCGRTPAGGCAPSKAPVS